MSHAHRCWSYILLLLALCLAPLVNAQSRSDHEASMTVEGTVWIGSEGQVVRYHLPNQARLAPALLTLIDEEIRSWEFVLSLVSPVEQDVEAKMRVSLVATPESQGKHQVAITGATFSAPGQAARTVQDVTELFALPVYPRDAAQLGIAATTYLALKIATDGTVLDAVSLQTNLHARVPRSYQQHSRRMFERNSEAAARRWKFASDTVTPDEGRDYATAIVPLAYCLDDMQMCAPGPNGESDNDGKWIPYIAGPRTRPAWLEPETDQVDMNTLKDGLAYRPADQAIRLRSPIGQ